MALLSHNGVHATTLHFSCIITTIIFLQTLTFPPANPLSFSYPGFQYGCGNFKLEGDAYILRSDIQLTLNEMYQNKSYSVGRVTSSEQMRLWDMKSRNLTDFSTNFSFLIHSYDYDSRHGDGFAFFIADPNLPFSKNIKEGGGLGLVDKNQVLNSTEYSFLAVEFDTYKNPWDPNGTHVGINVNSMRSKKIETWMVDISETRVYNCTVEYNSSTHNLSVYVTAGYGLSEQYLSYKVDLRNFLPEWVIFGFSAATGDLFEVHTLQSWSFSNKNFDPHIPPMAASPIPNPNYDPKHEFKQSKVGLLVGLGIGVFVVMSLLGLVLVSLWKKIKGKEEDLASAFDLNMDDEFQKGTGPKKFCYYELLRATNNFAHTEKLGQGGFGAVYKGFLTELDSYAAIKRISKGSKQGITEYATEVKINSKLRHRNLVQLIGWCHKNNDLLLIYEFMPNGSLDSHLYGNEGFLTWQVRYNIALGLASALLYLQEEWEQCVLHRDIKSSNIMLDSNFNAKLGDFGLARLVDHEKGSQTTTVAGTMGYIAPECITTGKANKESDIYSFGIVVLEIASGRKPINLKAKEGQVTIVEGVWELYGLGKLLEVADSKLCGVFNKQKMERLVVVGLWCAHPDYSLRPSIKQVIHVLNFEAPLPVIPKKMPVPTYLPPTTNVIVSSVSSSCEITC